jgi:PPP family 3-phenylpropionic acid transporter
MKKKRRLICCWLSAPGIWYNLPRPQEVFKIVIQHLSKNKVVPFSFFLLFFIAIAAFMPFMVLYYQELGFSGAQIGLLTGIPPLITMVTVPVWTRTADHTQRYRLIMSISLLVTAACLAFYPFMRSFPAVLVLTMITNLFIGPSFSLANSATMYMLGEEKDVYGRLRVGGSIGFGISTLIAGALVEQFDLRIAFWMGAAFFVGTYLVSLQLVYGQDEPEAEAEGGDIQHLLRRPNWIIFLLLAFISGVAMAAFNSYFFPYLSELGAAETAMGVALAVGILSEVPVLLSSNRFFGRFGGYGTLILSSAFIGLRMVLFGLTQSTLGVMLIQVLNGLSIPLFMVAGVFYADQLAPSGLRATSQGLFNAAMLGIGAAVGGFISGFLLVRIGAQALFLFIGVLVLAVLVVVVALNGRFQAAAETQG